MPCKAAKKLSAITIHVPDSPVTTTLVQTTNKFISTPDTGASKHPDPAATRRIQISLRNGVSVVLSKNTMSVKLRSAVLSVAMRPPVVLHPNTVATSVFRRMVKPIDISRALIGDRDGRTPGTPKVGCQRCTPGTGVVVIRKGVERRVLTVHRLTCTTRERKGRIKVVTAKRAIRFCGCKVIGGVKAHRGRGAVTEGLCHILHRFSRRSISLVCDRSFTVGKVKGTVVGHLRGTTKRVRLRTARVAGGRGCHEIVFIDRTSSTMKPVTTRLLYRRSLRRRCVVRSNKLIILFPRPMGRGTRTVVGDTRVALRGRISGRFSNDGLRKSALMLALGRAVGGGILSSCRGMGGMCAVGRFIKMSRRLPGPCKGPLATCKRYFRVLAKLVSGLTSGLGSCTGKRRWYRVGRRVVCRKVGVL